MTTLLASPAADMPPRRALAAFAGFLLALLAGALALITAPGEAAAQRDPAYAAFYETLDPHGEWVRHPRYGDTWVPYTNEDPEWRPYSRGQWVYTEEHGWYWESDEAFGWVVYHYGRWTHDDLYRWMWVPGTEWAPAWVAWREGEEAVGWAPLPPEAELGPGGELAYDAFASPRHAPLWMFVAPAMLTMPAIYRHFHPRQRSSWYFGQTRHATWYGYRSGRIYNRGVDRGFIEQRTRRPVPVLQVRPLTGPREWEPGRRPNGGRHVGVYRPDLGRPGGGDRGRPGWGGRPPGGRDFAPGRDAPGRDSGNRDRPGGFGSPGAPFRPEAGGSGPRTSPAGIPPAFGGGEQVRRPPFGSGGPGAGFGDRERPGGTPQGMPGPQGPSMVPAGAPPPRDRADRDRGRPAWAGRDRGPETSGRPDGPPPGFGRDRERPSMQPGPSPGGPPAQRPSFQGGRELGGRDFGGRDPGSRPSPPAWAGRPSGPPPAAAQPTPPPRPQVQAPPPPPRAAAPPAPPPPQPGPRRDRDAPPGASGESGPGGGPRGPR
jgi:hypothetical protein